MTDLLLNFDMVQFEDVDTSELDGWDEYEPYIPENRTLVRTEKTDFYEGMELFLESQDTFKLMR
jgi:hypothetical protein